MTLKTTKLPAEILLESGLLDAICEPCNGEGGEYIRSGPTDVSPERCKPCHGTGLKFWRLLMPHCWQHGKPPESIFDLQPADKLTGILLPLILQSPNVIDCAVALYESGSYVALFPEKGLSMDFEAPSFEQALALVWAEVYA